VVTLAFVPPAEPPPTPPAIYAPAPREISFGEIRGRVTAGTRIVSIRVNGVYKGTRISTDAASGGRSRCRAAMSPSASRQ
jgi:hypothetical protein